MMTLSDNERRRNNLRYTLSDFDLNYKKPVAPPIEMSNEHQRGRDSAPAT